MSRLTGPVTSISCWKAGVVYRSTSGRPSTARWSRGPGGYFATPTQGGPVLGVEDIPVRRLGGRRRRVQPAVSRQRAGRPCRVQVVPRGPCPRQRPVVLVPPDVPTHHEDLHGLLSGDPVVDSLHEVVVPAQSVLPCVEHRVLAQIEVAHLLGEAGVAAGNDHQALAIPGGIAAPREA